jgi:hypothetical protein
MNSDNIEMFFLYRRYSIKMSDLFKVQRWSGPFGNLEFSRWAGYDGELYGPECDNN